MILITGGAGFIGSNFVLDWLAACEEPVINLDVLTYAGHLSNLAPVLGDARHLFVQGDIRDADLLAALLKQHRPRAIIHFAAESHVDRSINAPGAFVSTNITGTFTLLEAARAYWRSLDAAGQAGFRFLHVSTDEVYGALAPEAPPSTETSAYAPNSPYAASKAGADHLVRSYHQTYGLPTLTTNCSNNYGPRQSPEKLVPLVLTEALAGRSLPLYGDGLQVRDWLYVSDHCAALRRVLDAGVPGQVYNVGGWNERTNLALVHMLCAILDRLAPKSSSYRDQVRHVADRPGHDRRYALDAGKIERELGWMPQQSVESGMVKTVQWYLANQEWVAQVQAKQNHG